MSSPEAAHSTLSCGGSVATRRRARLRSAARMRRRNAMSAPQGDSCWTLLMTWMATLKRGVFPFAKYYRAFTDGALPFDLSRSRDVLPLPAIASSGINWPSTLPAYRRQCFTEVLNMCGAGLNFLYSGGRLCALPRSLTKLHKRVYQRLQDKLLRSVVSIDQQRDLPCVDGAFAVLVGRDATSKFPDLNADAVDLLDACGQVDPIESLDPDVAQIVMSPRRMFPQGVRHLPRKCSFDCGARSEYIKLLVRQLRAGKTGLCSNPVACAPTFVVPKKDSLKQREVWNGGRIDRCRREASQTTIIGQPRCAEQLGGIG